jgi:formate hydrogenlyase subunit 6/NADH:ubiquinone oxidoreductase subunit I
LESHTEEITEPDARRPKKINVLDTFDIDYSLCMYCGICVDVCPFDALEWDQHRALIGESRDNLTLGIEELQPEK